MKKIIQILTAILCTIGAFAQSPQKMSYQSVIRDVSNSLVKDQAIGMQISILQGSSTGTPVYVENQTATTNVNGLLSIEIGGGTEVSGSFHTIDWANGDYFIKTETDPFGGTDYTITGTSQLLSVPYALHATTAAYLSEGISETQNLGDVLAQNNSAGDKNISDLLDPVNEQDAATKAYVDALEAKFTAMLEVIDPDFFTVTDADGNTYKVVIIGTQVWMAENLKTTRYSDGTPIPLVTDNSEWSNLSSPGYCWYNNDSATHASPYGALYNWYTVHAGNVCPAGWHVPIDDECTALITYLGGEDIAGGKLKETGTTHWSSPNSGASNESGFTALPGGFRSAVSGDFRSIGEIGGWLSATDNTDAVGNSWALNYLDTKVYHEGYKRIGSAVRCIRD